MKYLVVYVVMAALVAVNMADIYMHNPRGSNNRLNERSANRRNANRAFDSQVIYLRRKSANFNELVNIYFMKYFVLIIPRCQLQSYALITICI